MIIKNYLNFIKEQIDYEQESIGEKIERLSNGNEYLLNIISNYTQEINPTIRLSNAINMLSEENQKFLLKEVEEYLRIGEDDGKEVDLIAYTSMDLNENSQNVGGKNLFKSFLKIITALGQKNTINPEWDKTTEKFLIVFKTDLINILELKSVMSRYEFFNSFLEKIDYTHNECKLYYALGINMTLEYGIVCDGQTVTFGTFQLTKGIFNWLLTIDLFSATPLKRELVNLGYEKMSMMCKIKVDMKDFFPGSSQSKSVPRITNDVISFGFYGLGKWDNGQLDAGEWENAKQNFKTYVSKFRWSDKVQVGVSWDQFWTYFNIKLK